MAGPASGTQSTSCRATSMTSAYCVTSASIWSRSRATDASGGASINLASASGTWVLNQESATLWFSIVGATNLAETNYYDIGNIPVIPAISQQMVGVASSASSSTNSMQRSACAISLPKETSTLRVYVSPVADFQNTDTIYGSVTYLI